MFGLARSMGNLSNRLAAIEESLALFEQLDGQTPGRFADGLAQSKEIRARLSALA